MAGTVIISKGNYIDVRTVDFERIADALRNSTKHPEVAKKILQSKDWFGMDIICADELNSSEVDAFDDLLGYIRIELSDSPGLIGFIDVKPRLIVDMFFEQFRLCGLPIFQRLNG